MRDLIFKFKDDDKGQDLIEYALLTAIIGISGLLVLQAFCAAVFQPRYAVPILGANAWQPCPPQPATDRVKK